jgi:hypothetical protein
MDERIRRFRSLVEQQGGGRRKREGYPEEARRLAVEYGRDRLAGGDKARVVAAHLGIAQLTLLKWIDRAARAGVQEEASAETRVDGPIVVKDSLRNPHHLVAAARRGFERPWTDPQGRLRPSGRNLLHVAVYKSSVSRALRIMDALIKALADRGHEVVTEGERNGKTFVRFGVDRVEVALFEQVLMVGEAERWQRAERVRSYVAAVRTAAERSEGSPGTSVELEKWLEWASDCADALDPLGGGGCRVPEPRARWSPGSW